LRKKSCKFVTKTKISRPVVGVAVTHKLWIYALPSSVKVSFTVCTASLRTQLLKLVAVVFNQIFRYIMGMHYCFQQWLIANIIQAFPKYIFQMQ